MFLEHQVNLVSFFTGDLLTAVMRSLAVHQVSARVVEGDEWINSVLDDSLFDPEPSVVVLEPGEIIPWRLKQALCACPSAVLLVADGVEEAAGLCDNCGVPLHSRVHDEAAFESALMWLMGSWYQTYKNDWGSGVLDTIAGANIVADSDSMSQALRMVGRIAAVDAGVYISGETGTGKELIARAIHYLSERCDGPFIPVNCGAFTDDLLLSELFGHEKGAFTGAEKTHIGLIEKANTGTLFLDEIDTLSPKAQVVLLRYLQEQEYRPVGAENLRSTDVRVIAASNADIANLVIAQKFREDLWFRLDILRVDLPPLRERSGDIFLLSQFFLKQIAKKYTFDIKVLHPDTLRWMERYAWPGNVRELENFLHRAFLMSDGTMLRLPPKGELTEVDGDYPPQTFQAEKLRCIQDFERTYLERVLTESRGNISLAAKIADKERRAFTRLMEKYDLRRDQFLPREPGGN